MEAVLEVVAEAAEAEVGKPYSKFAYKNKIARCCLHSGLFALIASSSIHPLDTIRVVSARPAHCMGGPSFAPAGTATLVNRSSHVLVGRTPNVVSENSSLEPLFFYSLTGLNAT